MTGSWKGQFAPERVPATTWLDGKGFRIQVNGYRRANDLGPYPSVTTDPEGKRTPAIVYKGKATAHRVAVAEQGWAKRNGLDNTVEVEEHEFEGRTYFVTVWVQP